MKTHARIIAAIVAKDIGEAIKNRSIAVNILILPLMILFYKWLPTLYDPPGTRVVVYDEGNSQLVAHLENDPQYELRVASSTRELEETVDDMPMPVLGLSIPAGVDSPTELDGYVMHWVTPAQTAALRSQLEQQFAAWMGHPVRINPHVLYARPSSMGPIRSTAITTAVIVILGGLMIVPSLLLEEKQAKTMDALLISPASSGQIIVGKALVGCFYCSMIAVAALLINHAVILQWGWLVLTTVSGVLFTVALGLGLGIYFERRQQFSSWMVIIASFLLVPVFLTVMEPILPQALMALFNWMPAVALAKAFRFSFSQGAASTQLLVNLGLILGCTLLILVAAARRVSAERIA